MEAKRFNLRLQEDFDKYYSTLVKWWEDWKFIPMTPNLLSTNGVMISKDGVDVCAGWIFATDSEIGVIGWLISSKDKNRKGCIEQLLLELEKVAVSIGCKVVMSPASNPYLKNKLEKLGHGEFADRNVTNYFKKIYG